jgi:hypothetical protein
MKQISIQGSWGNLVFTAFTIILNKNEIKIFYGDKKNNLRLTFPYHKQTNFSMFEKFAMIDNEEGEFDFLIDGSDFYLYVDKIYKYNLSLYDDLQSEFFDILNHCLGFNFSSEAIQKWEKIIKHHFMFNLPYMGEN